MRSLHGLIPQDQYRAFLAETREWVSKSFKTSLQNDELTKISDLRVGRLVNTAMGEAFIGQDLPIGDPAKLSAVHESRVMRDEYAKKLIKGMFNARSQGKLTLEKAGVTTALGYNFYDLRAPVQLLYPVNTPMRNKIARVGKVNDGFGTAAHWKATRNPGSIYAGVSEGNRNAIGTPDENDYIATYKELGVERAATFTSQYAGEGFADNVADEHLRGAHSFFLQEEGMIWSGNSGQNSTGNGFNLGTAPTPTLSAFSAGGTIPNATPVSVACVLITSMGNPVNNQYGYGTAPSVANGLTPRYTRQNADGSQDVINGGISAISPMSAVSTSGAANQKITASVVPTKGAFGYAWFVNTTDGSAPTLANAHLYAITQFPSVVISSVANGANQAGNAANLSLDNSYNKLDFDGLLTYAAITPGSYWVDMLGGSFTSNHDGSVQEIEVALEYFFNNFQTGVTSIWGSADAILALSKAIRYQGTQSSGFQFVVTRDGQNNLLGGYVVSGYQSRYAVNSPLGANIIPLRIHPMMPAGTLYFDVDVNPYPHSRAPFNYGFLVQRDYYSIEWPVTSREWTFGTYAHEVLAHNFPWMTGVITGIGPYVPA